MFLMPAFEPDMKPCATGSEYLMLLSAVILKLCGIYNSESVSVFLYKTPALMRIQRKKFQGHCKTVYARVDSLLLEISVTWNNRHSNQFRFYKYWPFLTHVYTFKLVNLPLFPLFPTVYGPIL